MVQEQLVFQQVQELPLVSRQVQVELQKMVKQSAVDQLVLVKDLERVGLALDRRFGILFPSIDL